MMQFLKEMVSSCDRQMILSKVSFFLMYGSIGSLMPFMNVYFVSIGLSSREAGFITGYICIFFFLLPVSVGRRAKIFHRASTALSRRKYCVGKEGKGRQKQPPRSCPAGTAQRSAPLFYRVRADRIFFSPCYLRASFAAPLRQAV